MEQNIEQNIVQFNFELRISQKLFLSQFPLKKKAKMVCKTQNKRNSWIFWFFFYVMYSTLIHLPLLGSHSVEGCWDRTQDCG